MSQSWSLPLPGTTTIKESMATINTGMDSLLTSFNGLFQPRTGGDLPYEGMWWNQTQELFILRSNAAGSTFNVLLGDVDIDIDATAGITTLFNNGTPLTFKGFTMLEDPDHFIVQRTSGDVFVWNRRAGITPEALTESNFPQYADMAASPEMLDFAWDNRNKVLYGTTGTTLFSIDLKAGTKTSIGAHTHSAIVGLTYNWQDGILYALNADGTENRLVTVDVTDGSTTSVDTFGTAAHAYLGLTWNRSNNRLYTVNITTPSGTGKLQSIPVDASLVTDHGAMPTNYIVEKGGISFGVGRVHQYSNDSPTLDEFVHIWYLMRGGGWIFREGGVRLVSDLDFTNPWPVSSIFQQNRVKNVGNPDLSSGLDGVNKRMADAVNGFEVGSYTGNGVDGRTINLSNIKLEIGWLFIVGISSDSIIPILWTIGMARNASKESVDSGFDETGEFIQDVGTGFFKVSNDDQVNEDGETYSYIIFPHSEIAQ